MTYFSYVFIIQKLSWTVVPLEREQIFYTPNKHLVPQCLSILVLLTGLPHSTHNYVPLSDLPLSDFVCFVKLNNKIDLFWIFPHLFYLPSSWAFLVVDLITS